MVPPEDETISIVMPVYNALPHLDNAIRSILDQSYSAFEFIIYDDASTDGTTERLRECALKDQRIRLFEGERNVGPAVSSNRVVQKASQQLIARMDADDVAHPDRIFREVALLRQRPEVGLVGTLHDTIDADGRKLRGPDYWRLFRRSWFVPFPHGSIMYRREIFDQLGGYRKECEFWEDQDFFLRAAAVTTIVTIPQSLYQHRHSSVSTRVASDQERVERSIDLMYRSLAQLEKKISYENLLVEWNRNEPVRLDPRVFISLGSLVLWAGGRPRLVHRLLSKAKISLNTDTLSALIWTIWAALWPSALRRFLTLIAALRSSLVNRKKLGMTPVQWLTPKMLLTSPQSTVPPRSTSLAPTPGAQ